MARTIIKHLQQPTDKTCMSTVLAMIAGVDVHAIVDKYHDGFLHRSIWYDTVLRDLNIPHLRGQIDHAELMSGFAHFLTVPSLNIVGDFHAVLLLWPESLVNPIVLDPNCLRPGKHYYCFEAPDDEPMAHSLVNWRVDVYVPLAGQGAELEVVNGLEG